MEKNCCFASVVCALAFSVNAVADVTPTTTLGSTGSTDLQILAGDFIQRVCAGFVQNGVDTTLGNAAQQAVLFDKCGEMVHTANRLTDSGGPVANDLGITQLQLNAAVQNVVNEEAAAIGSNATELPTNQARNISKRVASLLSLKGGFQLSAAGLNGNSVVPVMVLKANEDDAQFSGLVANRWSFFSNIIAGSGEKDETTGEDGFDSDFTGFTLGADYRLGSNTVAGVALGYDRAVADFKVSSNVSGGDLELDSATLSAFGLVFGDFWFADAIVSIGSASYDIDRRLVVQATDDAIAVGNDGADLTIRSSTDSSQIAVGVTAGIERSFGATTLAPYTRVSSVRVEVDGYDEQGNSGLELRVRDQSIDSLTTAVGIRASHVFNTSFGVLAPQFTVEYIHEFQDDSREITTLYINDPRANELTLITDNPDRDFAQIGLAASAVLKNGWQVFGDVRSVLGLDTVSGSILTLGARKEF